MRIPSEVVAPTHSYSGTAARMKALAATGHIRLVQVDMQDAAAIATGAITGHASVPGLWRGISGALSLLLCLRGVDGNRHRP